MFLAQAEPLPPTAFHPLACPSLVVNSSPLYEFGGWGMVGVVGRAQAIKTAGGLPSPGGCCSASAPYCRPWTYRCALY